MAKDHHHTNNQAYNQDAYAEPQIDSKLIKIIHSLVLFGFSVIAVISGIRSFLKIGTSSANAIDIVNNWQSGTIMDISVQTNCTNGYEEAFNYTWPGNKPGCFCGDADYQQTSKYRINFNNNEGLCTTNQTNSGCINIHANTPVTVDSWSRIDGDEVKICVRRSNETWAKVAPNSGATCPPNTTQCGKSADNIFCTSEPQCPISQVEIVTLNASLGALKVAKCLYNTGCLTLSRDEDSIKILQFKRGDQTDALPLAQFRLNEYSMCNITAKDNISPGREDFYLLNTKREACGNEGADLWTLTDTTTEDKLFDINELTPTIDYLSDFGYYNDSKSGQDYQWNLFSRSYLPWNTSCRGDMGAIVAKTHGIGSLKIAQLLQLIATSVIGLLLGVVTPILILTDTRPGFTKVFNIVGKLLQAPFMLVATILAFIIGKFFTGFVTRQCSSPNVLSRLGTAGADAQNAFGDNLRGLIALVLAALFDLGLWLYKRYQRNQGEQYYPQVNVDQNRQHRGENEMAPYPQQTVTTTTVQYAPPAQNQQNASQSQFAPTQNQYAASQNQYAQGGVRPNANANVNVRVGI